MITTMPMMNAVEHGLETMIPSPEAIALLPEQAARRLQVVPVAKISVNGSTRLILSCEHPSDRVLAGRLERLMPAGIDIVLVQGDSQGISSALQKCYSRIEEPDALLASCECSSSVDRVMQDQPDVVVQLLEWILLCACREEASDVHFSPERDKLTIRFRVDGVLRTFKTISLSVFSGLLVRIKILSTIDIAETRQPQDGQFSQLVDARAVDFRVSCFPTMGGQNTVIRLLDPNRQLNSLPSLTLPAGIERTLNELCIAPEGMLLICGPTGSGKSTTLHAMLHSCDAATQNIMTLEDPVERSIAGVRQTSINAACGLDFADGVRGLLRQDPDILLIGEIRDTPSCAMAMRASMSGHKVLTTVHATSVFAGLSRLRELGAQSRQLAHNVLAIASQRLLRKRCTACQDEGVCTHCQGTGYHGRQAVMELLVITPQLSDLLVADAAQEHCVDCALREGFVPLRDQARRLVADGVTTMSEVNRVLGKETSSDERLLTTRRYGA